MRRGRRNGGKGKEGTIKSCSMAVIVDDDLWQIFKFNDRRSQRRSLGNFKFQKPSLWTTTIELKNLPKAVVQNDGQCRLTFDVAKCTTLVIF